MEFWVKREDLSSKEYGGNKVRTLQYQLAACEAELDRRESDAWQFLTFGSGGSNQVIATKTHAALLGLSPEHVECLTPAPDKKEMDNTLNYLSALSLPGKQMPFGTGLFSIAKALRGSSWVLPPGGHSPLGVLGQAGAMLELAEQIELGEVPDFDGIVVAMGSTCTISGICLGVALAHEAGFSAFRRPGFRIYGQPVHPGLGVLHRFFGLLHSKRLPLMIGRSLKSTSLLISTLGGPDVTENALRVMQERLVVSSNAAITGKYGAHSELSREAKQIYDTSAQAVEPPGAPHLWICGHFTGKSFAFLLDLLSKDRELGEQRKLLFWQTKSAIQPRGPVDEWVAFEREQQASKAFAK